MELHRDSTKWALAHGVTLNGIAAHRFPGKGLGIIAEKDFDVCPITSHTAIHKAGDVQ